MFEWYKEKFEFNVLEDDLIEKVLREEETG